MLRSRASLTSLAFLLVVSAWAGCSSDRIGIGNPKDGDFGSNDAGDASDDAGCSGLACSRDLRFVLDCYGKVFKECSADQACGNGNCIAPCDAAALNLGTVGCSYALPTPNNAELGAKGGCYAVFVANNWTSPATLSFERKGQPHNLDGAVWVPYVEDGAVKHKKLDGPIPPRSGAVVFVSNERVEDSNWVACPEGVTPILDKEGGIYGTGIGAASFMRSDVPVSVYSAYPYGGAKSQAASATLLFPTTSLRTNYVLVSSWGGKGDRFGTKTLPNFNPAGVQDGRPTIQIIAIEDDTAIDLLPRVDVVGGGGIQAAARNTVASYRLQRGEMLQLMQENELAGSVLQSTKPVGVFGGHSCMSVPADVGFCDTDNKQIPPVSAWGSEYAIMPAPNRTELSSQRTGKDRDPSPIRLVGAVNDTALVYEPYRPAGAPETLASGQLAVFFANDPVVVRSQDADHPFFAASVMTGSLTSSTLLGDPEVGGQIPTNQWLDDYGFYSDSSYLLSAVYVTRRRVDGAFKDVVLDCAGTLTGWQPINADYEWTFVELTRAKIAQVYPTGSCSDGPHRIHSESPFSMSVWGLGVAGSYSYPGGAGLRPITNVQVRVN